MLLAALLAPLPRRHAVILRPTLHKRYCGRLLDLSIVAGRAGAGEVGVTGLKRDPRRHEPRGIL